MFTKIPTLVALSFSFAVLSADAGETLRPITSYAESLSLSDAEFAQNRPFEITGQVVAVYPNKIVFFRNASGFFEILFEEAHGLKAGAVVSVRGHTKFKHDTSDVRDLIGEQLKKSFEKLSIEVFGEVGDDFDPNLHNAVSSVENEELPENSVAAVYQKGYKVKDKIIRHAMVQVANT